MNNPLAPAQIYEIGVALQKVGMSISYSDDSKRASREIGEAIRYLEQSLAHEETEFTEEEAEWSYGFHTYLRKFDDSAAGTLLYYLWDANSGTQSWKLGIKCLMENDEELNALNTFWPDSPKDKIMKLAFRAFGEIEGNISRAYAFLKENCLAEDLSS